MKQHNSPFFIKLAMVFTALATANGATTFTPAQPMHLTYDVGGKSTPTWSGGVLLVVEKNETPTPAVLMFDRTGISVGVLSIAIPSAQAVSVYGVSRNSSGTVAACGLAVDTSGRRAAFLALFLSGQTTARLIHTATYHPYQVAVAADGSVWTAGVEALERPPAGDTSPPDVASMKPYLSSGVIRHFSHDGVQLASFIPQSTTSGMMALLNSLGRPNRLTWVNHRVVWYCDADSRYVEIESDGSVMDLAGIPLSGTQGLPKADSPQVSGLALTENGLAFLSVGFGGAGNAWHNSIYLLDKAGKTWTPVLTQRAFIGLYGSDGNTLVTPGSDRVTVQYLSVSE